MQCFLRKKFNIHMWQCSPCMLMTFMYTFIVKVCNCRLFCNYILIIIIKWHRIDSVLPTLWRIFTNTNNIIIMLNIGYHRHGCSWTYLYYFGENHLPFAIPALVFLTYFVFSSYYLSVWVLSEVSVNFSHLSSCFCWFISRYLQRWNWTWD